MKSIFKPKYQITNHLLALLESITTNKAKIEASAVEVSWIPALNRDAMARIAHSSTAIEGNTLNLNEVKIIAGGGDIPQAKKREKQEIINYFNLIKHLEKYSRKQPITTQDVYQMHRIIGDKGVLDRGPVGLYRSYTVQVGKHTAPDAKKVPRLMTELLGWLNVDGQKLPGVFSSAILHYQFENIHPFGDGNGRVGRAWALWELYRRDFDTHHIFSVDEIFLENRQAYYRAFDFTRKNHEDLTGWIEFVVEAIDEALLRVIKRIQTIAVSSDTKVSLTPKQEKLLNLLKNSALSTQEIIRALEVSKAGVHFIIKPLLIGKLIKRVGGHKTGKYVLK